MKQYTMKILLNSLYGATALGSFRYGNVILSESITLSGQRIIQESALTANREMNKEMKGEDIYRLQDFDYPKDGERMDVAGCDNGGTDRSFTREKVIKNKE